MLCLADFSPVWLLGCSETTNCTYKRHELCTSFGCRVFIFVLPLSVMCFLLSTNQYFIETNEMTFDTFDWIFSCMFDLMFDTYLSQKIH